MASDHKNITVIILTFNEELHIQRCIDSLRPIAKEIIVVDSFSNDGTPEILKANGITVLSHQFVNYALQFQWALDNADIKTGWVMRMDADEYILPELAIEINEKLADIDNDVSGLIISRRVVFLDKWIKHGGFYPMDLLRIWRNGMGKIEARWMDEHIILSQGSTLKMEHDLVDENLNNLSWWTDKHNRYATREAIDILNKKYAFLKEEAIDSKVDSRRQMERRRWIKDNLYVRTPLFLRPFGYFFLRYFIQLGFLDGKQGLIWHFLQGFWYRFLVDAKIYQLERYMKKTGVSVVEAIEQHFQMKIENSALK